MIEDKINMKIITDKVRKEAGKYDMRLEYHLNQLLESNKAKEALPYMDSINKVLQDMHEDERISDSCVNDYSELFNYVVEHWGE